MLLTIAGVLSPADLHEIRSLLSEAVFEDGTKSAGWQAEPVKRNEQAKAGHDITLALQNRISARIRENSLFRSAARPKNLTPLIISRYRPAMSYGLHIDNSVMGGIRTDLSMTLFLSDPDSYEGGALVLDRPDGRHSYRPPAGSLVLYPTGMLHEVEAVTKGERIAAVGWVQSLIRNAEQRELLFEMEQARMLLEEDPENHDSRLLLARCQASLMRMWVEL